MLRKSGLISFGLFMMASAVYVGGRIVLGMWHGSAWSELIIDVSLHRCSVDARPHFHRAIAGIADAVDAHQRANGHAARPIPKAQPSQLAPRAEPLGGTTPPAIER